MTPTDSSSPASGPMKHLLWPMPKIPVPPGLIVSGPDSGQMAVECPWDGSPLDPVSRSTPELVEQAAKRARVAQETWRDVPLRQRAKVAERFADLVLRNREKLLDLIQLETGKNRSSAFEEVLDVIQWSNYLAANAPRILGERRVAGAIPALTRTVVRYQPQGLVGVITPWNYPMTLPATDVLPALIAGNAVILKPDSATPHTGIAVASLLVEAGVPRGVLQVVLGSGATIGTALIEQADFMMFTGSTQTGRTVATECAERLISLSAELGGKNPLLVLSDADLKKAVPGTVHASFSNTGQLCIAIERIYVHEKLWDQFVPAFVEQVSALKVGSGYDWEIDMGTLTNAQQLRKLESQVRDAVSKGARVLTGGRARPDLGPYFFEPTVLVDVPADAEIFAEETFGPAVAIYRVSSDAEALAAANDSAYGLNASVWSEHQGTEIARQLRTGTVNVNAGYAAAWASYAAPMGGMGISGLGRRHGSAGILKYAQAQTIAQQRLMPLHAKAGQDPHRWAEVMTTAARWLKYWPGR